MKISRLAPASDNLATLTEPEKLAAELSQLIEGLGQYFEHAYKERNLVKSDPTLVEISGFEECGKKFFNFYLFLLKNKEKEVAIDALYDLERVPRLVACFWYKDLLTSRIFKSDHVKTYLEFYYRSLLLHSDKIHTKYMKSKLLDVATHLPQMFGELVYPFLDKNHEIEAMNFRFAKTNITKGIESTPADGQTKVVDHDHQKSVNSAPPSGEIPWSPKAPAHLYDNGDGWSAAPGADIYTSDDAEGGECQPKLIGATNNGYTHDVNDVFTHEQSLSYSMSSLAHMASLPIEFHRNLPATFSHE